MSSHPSQYEHQTTYIKYYFCIIRKFSYFTNRLLTTLGYRTKHLYAHGKDN